METERVENIKIAVKKAVGEFEAKLTDCSSLAECRSEVDKLKNQLDQARVRRIS